MRSGAKCISEGQERRGGEAEPGEIAGGGHEEPDEPGDDLREDQDRDGGEEHRRQATAGPVKQIKRSAHRARCSRRVRWPQLP
jgi:hypothetical protein